MNAMNARQSIGNPELVKLVQTALDLAKAALAEQDTFLPGSIAVLGNGKLHIGVAGLGGVEGSNMLTTALRQKAATERLKAAALYRDVRVRPQGASTDVDAIHVVAELASGEAVHLFQVYQRSSAGKLVLGEREIESAPSVVFGALPRPAKRWWEVWR